MNNLVVFGPAHGGKSSLIGFLMAAALTPDELADRIRSLDKDLNGVEDADKYRLLVDEHDEERKRRNVQGHGTSWYMHTKAVKINARDVFLIDTPGREHERTKREMLRGLFYGDLGILMLDIQRFSDEEHLFEDFSQLAVWLNFGHARHGLIIAISKMDTVAFSQQAFESAADLCGQFIEDISAGLGPSQPLRHHIIPIAIDFRRDMGHNILTSSADMPWYSGETLTRAIAALEPKPTASPAPLLGPLLMCIRKTLTKTHVKPQGLIVEGKIMSGRLETGGALKIVPVLVKKRTPRTRTPRTMDAGSDDWVFVSGTAAEVRALGGSEETSQRVVGDLTSINLADLRVSGRLVKPEDIQVPPSAIIALQTTPCRVGRVLSFVGDHKLIKSLSLLNHVSVLWFGRMLQAQVVCLESLTATVVMELLNDYGAMAINEDGEFVQREFVIRVDRDGVKNQSERALYFPVTLTAISSMTEMRYRLPKDFPDESLDEWVHGIQYVTEGDRLVFEQQTSCIAALQQLKDIDNTFYADPGSFGVRVSLRPKEGDIF